MSVPVLSNANAVTPASRSSADPPLMSTPVPASRPSAAITAAGVARISAHGHATTSTASAGYAATFAAAFSDGLGKPGGGVPDT